MSEHPIGISDISLYVPQPQIEISTITRERILKKPELEKSLLRATETAGQIDLRFPNIWEDTSTIAAQSARKLFQQNSRLDVSKLRYLTVGTETPIDHSKAVSAYVEGMLQRAGHAIPKQISTFQVQHACAGGFLGAISVGALLNLSNRPQESGLIICSDIARYTPESTAEVTQGAGAAALLVENDPKLIELDLSNMGFSSEDVDDFFRPLGSVVAKVKGLYSIQCYNSSLETAFADHCDRRGESPEAVLRGTDYFVLHTPFRNMPYRAMLRLLGSNLGLSKEEAESFLQEHAFPQAIDPIARVGNTYTASIFMSLAFLLDEQYKLIGDKIAGKTVLMASYGSGNTMAIIAGRVSKSAPDVLKTWKLWDIWDSARPASMMDYERWLGAPYDRERYAELVSATCESIPSESFYLSGIREDGYREYRFK
ncbi:MAG TPA: hydroxymethylglutaryl-CoA synthase [Spirochaetia bacterium]|nr:hydroxymethylglutaryl-CoA synthase [Spirochaetia bacterium]